MLFQVLLFLQNMQRVVFGLSLFFHPQYHHNITQSSQTMKTTYQGVNRESFGHQSVMTAWAKDDGRPILKDGASEEEHEKWAALTTAWALRGGSTIVNLGILEEKHSTLSKNRFDTSLEYAKVRKLLTSEKETIANTQHAIDDLLVTLEESKNRLYQMDVDGKVLFAKRIKIDQDKKIIAEEIATLKGWIYPTPRDEKRANSTPLDRKRPAPK